MTAALNHPHGIELLGRGWRASLDILLNEAKKDLTVVSPYIRSSEANYIANGLSPMVNIITMTRLDDRSLLEGALQLDALRVLGEFSPNSKIINLPRLHAKVYIADKSRAIITSGNLTKSGIDLNYEYGVGIANRRLVGEIYHDLSHYATLGKTCPPHAIDKLSTLVNAAQQKRINAEEVRRQDSAEKNLRRTLAQLNDECQRLYVGEDTPTGLFKKALLYFLVREKLNTKELHHCIQNLYPELCDSDRHRIINGRSFGKLWKHHLRNAQQMLKKEGRIVYNQQNRKWQAIT